MPPMLVGAEPQPATTRGGVTRSVIGRRVLLVFATHLALFGVALGVVLVSARALDAADAEVSRLDRAKAAAYRVAALVREQYIHQAHTIIEGNRSHVDHYEDVAQGTRTAIQRLREGATTEEDERSVDAVLALVGQNDREFHDTTLPAIDRQEHDRVRELHRGTEDVIVRALAENKALMARFEHRSEAARARAERLRDRTRWTALLCFGLSAAFAAVGAVATARWIAARVMRLRAGANAIGAGLLDSRIGLSGRDEFAEIGRSIDQMAADLERHQEVTMRAQKLASIGQVAAGVAHEINNPLGVILGYVKTMRRRDERDDEGLDIIEEEATQCRRIVAGLLDLAKPQGLSIEEVDIGEQIRATVDRLATTGKLGERLVAVVGDDGVRAEVDPGKLRQVLSNILTNAVEASSKNIEVCVQQDAEVVTIAVRDDGAGIGPDVRPRLFEPFVTTKKGGVGLGLAIAHAIVDAHRGRITCSAAEGEKGTTMCITLPSRGLPER